MTRDLGLLLLLAIGSWVLLIAVIAGAIALVATLAFRTLT